MPDRLREGLPKDLQDLDLLIRTALEDPAVRARVEKVLPTRPPGLPLGDVSGAGETKRARPPRSAE